MVAMRGQARCAPIGGTVEPEHNLPLEILAPLAPEDALDAREGIRRVLAHIAAERQAPIGSDGSRVAEGGAHIGDEGHVGRGHDHRVVLVVHDLAEEHHAAVARVVDGNVEGGALLIPAARIGIAQRRAEIE